MSETRAREKEGQKHCRVLEPRRFHLHANCFGCVIWAPFDIAVDYHNLFCYFCVWLANFSYFHVYFFPQQIIK
ncbi:hypothetical protein BRADI_3g47385v3 [Brachypodium distachyon]|uniref:Uncharacterized protein n=1 Tax=Brachypodium distachyon TaxID=15368 RepID=A0A2K2D3U5_BRADI|nr:hypothetical protein BRADI_3g47385v3 [Brachypodium distachyon]